MNGRPTNNTTVPGYSYSGTVTGWGGKWPDPPVLGEMPCTVDQPGQRCRQGSLPICRVHAALHVPVPDPARLPPAFQVSDFAAEVAEATGGKA